MPDKSIARKSYDGEWEWEPFPGIKLEVGRIVRYSPVSRTWDGRVSMRVELDGGGPYTTAQNVDFGGYTWRLVQQEEVRREFDTVITELTLERYDEDGPTRRMDAITKYEDPYTQEKDNPQQRIKDRCGWPICMECCTPVDKVKIDALGASSGRSQWEVTVLCHGETEKHQIAGPTMTGDPDINVAVFKGSVQPFVECVACRGRGFYSSHLTCSVCNGHGRVLNTQHMAQRAPVQAQTQAQTQPRAYDMDARKVRLKK